MNINELKVTPWNQQTDLPPRVGVYEVKPEYVTSHRVFSYWDGGLWSRDAVTPEQALMNHGYGRHTQQVVWRGVVQ